MQIDPIIKKKVLTEAFGFVDRYNASGATWAGINQVLGTRVPQEIRNDYYRACAEIVAKEIAEREALKAGKYKEYEYKELDYRDRLAQLIELRSRKIRYEAGEMRRAAKMTGEPYHEEDYDDVQNITLEELDAAIAELKRKLEKVWPKRIENRIMKMWR